MIDATLRVVGGLCAPRGDAMASGRIAATTTPPRGFVVIVEPVYGR